MKLKNQIAILFLMMISLSMTYAQENKSTHSFSLKECIAYGLENHYSVRVYSNKQEQAHQQVREYMSNYLPQVEFTAGLDDNLKLQQTVIPEGTFGPGSPEQRVAFGSQWNSAVNAQATQVIYSQSMISGIKGAKMNKELVAMQANQNSEDLIYEIAKSYYDVLVTQKQLELLESNKERLEEVLRITKLQEEKGVAKKVDVNQVNVNLNNVVAQISNVQNGLVIVTNILKVNLGINPDDELKLTDTEVWIETKPTLKEYARFNYENTLEGRMQQLQVDLLQINERTIKAQFVPTLAFYARYGANTFAQKFPDLYDPLLDYSSIGLQLSWKIFTGFNRNAQAKQANLEVQNTLLNYDLNKSMRNIQYQNAESKFSEAQRTIHTNKENVELAAEVYDDITLQYQNGIASISDLLNAELAHKEAQTNYINSLLQYYQADLEVRKVNGTLTEYFNNL